MGDEVTDVIPYGGYSRRRFMVTTLASGFAVLAGPVMAQTVVTTTREGLRAGEVQVPVEDGQVPAYRAMPASGGPFPVVLVVQEIFGVHEHIKDICRRLAHLGYLAIAPELYARQGDVSAAPDRDAIFAIVRAVPDAQVMADLDACVAWAASSGEGDVERLGITGFCWGGRIVWLYAAHNPQLKAGVAWYGRLIEDPRPLQPRHPLDMVEEIEAPVLGLYGGADEGIPVEHVERMQAALQAAGKEAAIHIYPDAPHAFYADYRSSYREGPAKDGWERMKAWFARHGVV
jgi:carboxymethylenebutenolidase